MDIVMNQVAIWQPCGAKKLNARQVPIGVKYRDPNGVIYKVTNKTLTRYAKDYSVKKVGFSLFIRTDCEDAKLVENFLNECAKHITKEYAQNAVSGASIDKFEYTPYILGQTQFTEEK